MSIQNSIILLDLFYRKKETPEEKEARLANLKKNREERKAADPDYLTNEAERINADRAKVFRFV